MSGSISHIRSIDALRGFSVLAVLLFHFYPDLFQGGFLGVDIFFVISGFVITLALIKMDESDPWKMYRQFVVSRIKRLVPALLSTASIVGLVFFIVYPSALMSLVIESIAASLMFISNLYFGSMAGYWDTTSKLMPMLHTWSLSLEWQFYLLYPLIFLYMPSRKYIPELLVVVFIISIVVSFQLSVTRPTLNFYGIQSRVWELTAGGLAAMFCARGCCAKYLQGNYAKLTPIIFCTLFFLYVLFCSSSIASAVEFVVPLIAITAVTLVFVFHNDSEISSLFPVWLFRLGEISYSVYLVHFPIVTLLYWYDLDGISLLMGMVLSILLGFAQYKLIECRYRYGDRTIIYVYILFVIFSVISVLALKGSGSPIDEHERYVREGFDNRILGSEKDDYSVKGVDNILIIGDSYAQDFFNIVSESGQFRNNQVFTYFIPQECLPSYLPMDKKAELLEFTRIEIELCGNFDLVNDRPNFSNFSTVVMASNWRDNNQAFIKSSVVELRKVFSGLIVVVGTKHFGKVNPYVLNEIDFSIRRSLKNKIVSRISHINNQILLALDGLDEVVFIDLMQGFCADNEYCMITDDNGALLTYDGGHLTRSGAMLASRNLNLESVFSD